MATEITEFSVPPTQYGAVVPTLSLPYIKHTSLDVGDVIAFEPDTRYILITPGEDVRVAVTIDGSTPDPDSDSMLLPAGYPRDFHLPVAGMKLKAVAA